MGAVPSLELPAAEPLAAVEKQPHPHFPDRWADGTTRPGYPGPGLKHGAYSGLVAAGTLPSQAEAAAAILARQADIVADKGGSDVVGVILRGSIQRHVKLEVIETTLWDNLQKHGTLTGKGKSRAAALLWLQVVDRLQKSAAAIGIDRKSKDVGSMSISQYLEHQRQDGRSPEGGL